MTISTILVTLLSVYISYLTCKTTSISNSGGVVSTSWREYGWLKMAREEKPDTWYNPHPLSQTYTRPPLNSYVHYYVAAIFTYLYPEGLSKIRIGEIKKDIPAEMEYSMNNAMLIANLLTYFPAVIFVVIKLVKTSNLAKLTTMLLLLNAPSLTIVDYVKVEFTGPHLAFFILAIYFAAVEWFTLGAVLLAISALLQQTMVWYLIPFALYAVATTFRKGKDKNVFILRIIFYR